MHSSLLTWRDHCLKQIKDRSHNRQNRRYGKISSHIYETYNNAVRPHSFHIFNTAVDMSMETIFSCNSEHYGIPHWKCVLRCFDKRPSIVLPSQESNKDTTITCPTILFHVYHNV